MQNTNTTRQTLATVERERERESNPLKTFYFINFLLFFLTLQTFNLQAQNVGINATGAAPNTKALLDVDAAGSSTKGGLLVPRLTTAERNAITAPIPMSLLIFNTNNQCFEAWNQTTSTWISFGCINCQLPDPFTVNTATNITATSFDANWTTSAGATAYFLDVATDASFTSFVAGYNNLNVGNVLTSGVAGLTCGTYYYRVRANNTCGTSTNSGTITLNQLLPAAPTAATHTPSATQIVWNWNTVTGATGYKWNTVNNYATATDNAASTTHTQTGLIPSTAYTLYVWAYNSCGNSSVTTLTSTTISALYVEDVFSAYTYTGNGSSQTITNDIDLAGNGGLVWIKSRTVGASHGLYDSNRGVSKPLLSSTNDPQLNWSPNGLTTFNSNGFGVADNALGSYGVNGNSSGQTYASWTFRKAAKFFDVVTWTGDGVNNRQIPHNLGIAPGMVIIKRTDASENWVVCHRGTGSGNAWCQLSLNSTSAGSQGIPQSSLNSTTLDVTNYTGASSSPNGCNTSGATYVAYIFAHDAAADGIIQCGSFTTDGSGNASVTLGWEPQYVLFKSSTQAEGWDILDDMRGFGAPSTGATAGLSANSSNAEAGTRAIYKNATGFTSVGGFSASQTYIYLAIRRGPMKTPTAGTQVYNAIADNHTQSARSINTVGFAPDMMLNLVRSNANYGQHVIDRLRGSSQNLYSEYTNAENTQNGTALTSFDMNGVSLGTDNAGTGVNAYSGYTSSKNFFKRAPGFFDEVCYTGTGAAHTEAHNLGVVPELVIIKGRSQADTWTVGSTNLANTDFLYLSANLSVQTGANRWNSTYPTSTVFSLGTASDINSNTQTYVAYLFATLPGVSKVGSYTGNGGTQTIACGFSTTARFILIKRTDVAGDWLVWDTALGIVTGNDSHVSLNSASAEVTTDDSVDPDTSGFIVNQVAATNINVNAATYIFLAIN